MRRLFRALYAGFYRHNEDIRCLEFLDSRPKKRLEVFGSGLLDLGRLRPLGQDFNALNYCLAHTLNVSPTLFYKAYMAQAMWSLIPRREENEFLKLERQPAKSAATVMLPGDTQSIGVSMTYAPTIRSKH